MFSKNLACFLYLPCKILIFLQGWLPTSIKLLHACRPGLIQMNDFLMSRPNESKNVESNLMMKNSDLIKTLVHLEKVLIQILILENKYKKAFLNRTSFSFNTVVSFKNHEDLLEVCLHRIQ